MFEVFVVVIVFLNFVQNTLFVTHFCNFVCNANLFSTPNIFQDLWPIIRV